MALHDVATGVSEEFAGSIFRVEATYWFETLGRYRSIRCRKPGGHNLHLRRCENLNSLNVLSGQSSCLITGSRVLFSAQSSTMVSDNFFIDFDDSLQVLRLQQK
jgi:hypothetical protein